MSVDSTNLVPPFLGPGFPTYPQTLQICRVYGAIVTGTVYNAFTQQYAPTLTLRDREPCYVWAVDRNDLTPGYFFCRLIGSYNNLPLYGTTSRVENAEVTNVCPVFGTVSGVQVVTGLIVEYTLPSGQVFCVLNPTGCCTSQPSGSGDTNCCALSALCLTCANVGGSLACLNGNYTMTTMTGTEFFSAPFSCSIYGNLQWRITCYPGLGYNLELGNNFSTQTNNFQTLLTYQPYQPVTCSAFSLSFPNITIGNPADGNVEFNCNVNVLPGSCSGSGGGCGITDTALGTVVGTNVASVTLPSVTVQPGLLVVNIAAISPSVTVNSVTFAGTPLTLQETTSDSNNNTVYQFSLAVGTTTTGDIVASSTGLNWTAVLLDALEVQGLVHNAVANINLGNGSASQPALLGYPTLKNCTFTSAAFLLTTPGGSWTWASPFTSGGQDVTSGIYNLTEGFVIEPTPTTLTPKLNGVTPALWCGISVSYY